MIPADAPRAVLVHDWLTGMRGGEKCLEVLCRRWPHARLMTLFHVKGAVSPAIERLNPETSFLQNLPGIRRYYRHLLPLLPLAAARDAGECDLVVSFSHCVAKGVRVPAGVPHVCYCFSPMRYAWHMRDAYFGRHRLGRLKAAAIEAALARLRAWDRATAAGVTHFVAISETIRRRIADCYGRDSTVIYPPADTDFYTPSAQPREAFYLVVSALAPYKRVDLAVKACHWLGRELIVIGSGQDAARLASHAGPGIRFLGWQSDEVIRDHLRRCRALLFPGEEDFGIVPVEAMACGTPVIAYGKGGATETVVPMEADREPTGVWFPEQTAESLAVAIEAFEARRKEIDPAAARRQAERFSLSRFEAELLTFLEATCVGTVRRAA